MYQALYRKWRPRTFDEVVGQTHITETLKRQVAAGRLSHAYLFTGTRGTGKTSCAKLLARAVNCEAPAEGNPCNRCPACLGIENGSILDVLELDAASNNGVDQIRALRDEAVYTPAAVRKRVYIVDEVHMLSTPAFNALLKILEEPPEHLMFILATTELHKVPATIKSRCQQFAFKRISPKGISDHLRYVAKQEALGLADPAADLLARLADGGLRDGLSLLDQCSGGEGEITEETVLEVLGLTGNRRTAKLLDRVAQEDTAGALTELDALYRDGKDMGALLGELSALIRDLLIRKSAPEGGRGLLTGGYEEKVTRQLAERFTAAELVQMMTILQTAQAGLYRSTSRRLDAELCLIRLCDRRLSETVDGLTARLSRVEAQLKQGGAAARPGAGPESAPQAEEPSGPADFSQAEEDDDVPWAAEDGPLDELDLPPWDAAPPPPWPERSAPAEEPAAPPPEPPAPHGEGKTWRGFLATLTGVPPMLQAFFFSTNSVTGTFEGDNLVVWVDTEPTKSALDDQNHRDFLEQAAQQYVGRPVRVLFRVGKPEREEPEFVPEEDNFDDLLALGDKFGNFNVT